MLLDSDTWKVSLVLFPIGISRLRAHGIFSLYPLVQVLLLAMLVTTFVVILAPLAKISTGKVPIRNFIRFGKKDINHPLKRLSRKYLLEVLHVPFDDDQSRDKKSCHSLPGRVFFILTEVFDSYADLMA
jgi:hypothetical protein